MIGLESVTDLLGCGEGLAFKSQNDRDAAMKDFHDGSMAEEDYFSDDDSPTVGFPPKLSDYRDANFAAMRIACAITYNLSCHYRDTNFTSMRTVCAIRHI